MILSMIVAYTKDDEGRLIIGKDGTLPWRIPADMVWFKECTRGHAVIMGRKTYESIGRPLPKRDNIVLTSDPNYKAPGVTVMSNLDTAIKFAGKRNQEVFIIGGQAVYEQAFDKIDRLYVTYIENNIGYVGDTFFPSWSRGDFKVIQRDTSEDEKNGTIKYYIYQRYKYTVKPIDPMAQTTYNIQEDSD